MKNGLLLLAIGFGLNLANGQTINGVCRANEVICGYILMNDDPGVDNFWTSIYGSSLPTSSTTFVRITYSVIQGPGLVTDSSEISASSPHQTWWYSSSTQINFYAYPQNLATGLPPDSFIGTSGTVTVCSTFAFIVSCSNTVSVSWSS
jgi:hypothetical protein